MSAISKLGIVFVFMTLLLTVLATPLVSAQTTMSDAHVERIRANCLSAQNTLRQLRTTDALLRVNRGQVYESISVKLMAAMNSRIALNRLNGGSMVSIAADYEKELIAFRASYIDYEKHITDLLSVDCVKQPITFYDQVAITRAKRIALHDHVLKLNKYIVDYKTAFDAFSAQYTAQSNKVNQ